MTLTEKGREGKEGEQNIKDVSKNRITRAYWHEQGRDCQAQKSEISLTIVVHLVKFI